MRNVNNWFSIITNNDIHAYNKVNSRDLAICFNFLQIPDTSVVVLTATIMKNKVKKNSLDSRCFARVMSCIENSLNMVWQENNTDTSISELYKETKSYLPTDWYVNLCCHRVFFVEEKFLFEVIKEMFSQENIKTMKDNDLTEVSVFVNTDHYDFNAKFY